ncbi:Protein of unknown function [Cotesia congregata]|uniref:Uncharacterized protein n=1 Tax=Cotesia congregata TaxID=51543 RepID=A0A8J2HG25_COTCN|nr:Protein of unknown function [Cotesia congregata]
MERIYCVFTCLEQDRKKNKNYINNNNNNGDEDEKKLRIFVFQGTYIFFIVVNTKIDSIWYVCRLWNTRWEKGRRRKIKVFGAGFKDKGDYNNYEREEQDGRQCATANKTVLLVLRSMRLNGLRHTAVSGTLALEILRG